MAALTAPDGTALPDPLPLPTGIVSGRLMLPASKSVAQRVLNLALLSGEPLTIDNPPSDEDSLAFARALEVLGWSVAEWLEGAWRIIPPVEREYGATIDCASSGTALRLLTATLSTLRGVWTVTGSEQLARRPLGGLVEALRRAGVKITLPSRSGLAGPGTGLPFRVEGGPWTASEITIDASTSSQYLSALLMAAAAAKHPVTITATGLVSAPYVDLTLAWMRRFGVAVKASPVEAGRATYTVDPGFRVPQSRRGKRIRLEGDWSSACYPMAGAALTGGTVTLEGLDLDSAQADRAFIDVLRQMGGVDSAPLAAPSPVASPNQTPLLREPRSGGEIVVAGTGALQGLDVDMNAMPDQVPTLAALAPFAAGTTTISGVAHLRHKESDRLAVLARELGKLGVPVEERDDGLAIEGVWHDTDPPADPVTVDPVVIDPEGDHRIAMAAAVLAARRPGVSLADPGVVAKSCARFWQDWAPLLAERE